MANENIHAVKSWVKNNITAKFFFEPEDRSFWLEPDTPFSEILSSFEEGSNISLSFVDDTQSIYDYIDPSDYEYEIPEGFKRIATLTSVSSDKTKIYFSSTNFKYNWEFTYSSDGSLVYEQKQIVTSYQNLPNKPINIQEVEINDYEYDLDTSFNQFADTYGSTLYHIHTGDFASTHLDFYLISFSFSEDQDYCKQTLYDASSQNLLTRDAIYNYETSSWDWNEWKSRLAN